MAQYCPHCMQIVNGDFCPHCGGDIRVRSSPAQLPVGTVLEAGISRYQVGVALGQGGFGITYIAMDLRSYQRVAIKEYFPNLCAYRAEDHIRVRAMQGKDSMFLGGRSSFLKEAQMLASLGRKPGIVEIHNYFETNGTAYLVMEYLDGMTLKSIVSRHGRIGAEEFLPKLPPLISSLAQIHKQNVIHRDISPDNIMWMPDGSLKLLDFGCARSMEDGKALTVMYKPGFAPIEQYLTHGQGTWTDVYALCGTIYYCITGKVPQASIERLDNDKLLPPTVYGANLSPEQESALMWGLTVQPKERPVNMEAFAFRFCPDKPKKPVVFQNPTIITSETGYHNDVSTGNNTGTDLIQVLIGALPEQPIIRILTILAITAASIYLIAVSFI